ncbi:MAG: DMT family transporter [Fluviicoccus sp.]|uniref:DMT family transporter n=1 Tax=Fluviicoccus sp. TaxID=2003552 RepID=UPI0027262F72|nr:DMT family transporter [Fluviicoccus sp.]MDO8330885.1 DMT family transporter [Fluviicoccus sp.]
MFSSQSRVMSYGILLFTLCVWTSFILISRLGGKSELTPWDITALRFGTAALVLLPVVVVRGVKHYFTLRFLTLAMLGGLGYAGLAYAGFERAPASHGAVLLSGILPFWTAVATYLVLGERMTRDRWITLTFIAAGIGSMAWGEMHHEAGKLGWGEVCFIAASCCWGFYGALLKRWQTPPLEATMGVALLSALVFMPVYAAFLPSGLDAASWPTIITQSLFQGILVVIVAMLSFIEAQRRLGPFTTGAFLALAPVLGATLAVPLLGEPLTLSVMLGLAGVSIGATQPWKWRMSRQP